MYILQIYGSGAAVDHRNQHLLFLFNAGIGRPVHTEQDSRGISDIVQLRERVIRVFIPETDILNAGKHSGHIVFELLCPIRTPVTAHNIQSVIVEQFFIPNMLIFPVAVLNKNGTANVHTIVTVMGNSPADRLIHPQFSAQIQRKGIGFPDCYIGIFGQHLSVWFSCNQNKMHIGIRRYHLVDKQVIAYIHIEKRM